MFFASTRIASGKALFQAERISYLFIDVLRSTMRTKGIVIHGFIRLEFGWTGSIV
jgi:hypothetical protein